MKSPRAAEEPRLESCATPGAREARILRLPLTSDCNLRCSYCFVDKEAGETLSEADALRGVDWLLSGAGESKTLDIYGGEPFAAPGLLRSIAARARAAGRARGKRVAIRIATNAVLAREEDLRFLSGLGVRLHVSLDGDRADHDAGRVYGSGAGSWAEARAGLDRVLKHFSEDRVTILMGVAPDRADRCAENVRAAASWGVRHVNIEPIFGRAWSPAELDSLRRGLEEVWAGIEADLPGGRALLLASVAKGLRARPADGSCSLFRQVELFPDGFLYAHSYPLPAGASLRRARLGRPFALRLPARACVRRPEEAGCSCRDDYFAGFPTRPGGEAVELRDRLSRRFAARLAARAAGGGPARAYLAEALARAGG